MTKDMNDFCFLLQTGIEISHITKRFNNCYILLSNISQVLKNTKFIAGELSLRLSLVL